MCTACVLPKNTIITSKECENMYAANPDGIGYAWVEESGLQVRKYLKYEEFEKAFKVDFQAHNQYSDFLLHFRAKSQGDVSVENVHPFWVNDDLVMIHNGTIMEMPNDKVMSDTALFAEFLGSLPKNWVRNKTMRLLVLKFIGPNNKLAFLDSRGKHFIFNESSGKVDTGRWFSNDFFKLPRPSSTTTAYKSSTIPYTPGTQSKFPVIIHSSDAERDVKCYSGNVFLGWKGHRYGRKWDHSTGHFRADVTVSQPIGFHWDANKGLFKNNAGELYDEVLKYKKCEMCTANFATTKHGSRDMCGECFDVLSRFLRRALTNDYEGWTIVQKVYEYHKTTAHKNLIEEFTDQQLRQMGMTIYDPCL